MPIYNFKHSAVTHRIIDADTGKDIPDVLWADTDAGEVEVYRRNPDGSFVLSPDAQKLLTTKRRVKCRAEPVVSQTTSVVLEPTVTLTSDEVAKLERGTLPKGPFPELEKTDDKEKKPDA